MIIEDMTQGSRRRAFIATGRRPMLNILVACKEPKAPGGLEHLGDYQMLYDSSPGWGAASNALLDKAAELGGDALFCDDDVAFTPACLSFVQTYYNHADLFGLDLHDLAGQCQQGARHTMTAAGEIHDWVYPGPAYVAHVSTSAIYIKADAIQSGLRFPVWEGIHWEDVAFCLDAWLRGFRVLAVPGYVHHAIEGGVGSTKRHDAAFWERWGQNKAAFNAWCAERDLSAVPREAIPV